MIKMAYRLKFIDSERFISSLLSSLNDNLGEELHNVNIVKLEYAKV